MPDDPPKRRIDAHDFLLTDHIYAALVHDRSRFIVWCIAEIQRGEHTTVRGPQPMKFLWLRADNDRFARDGDRCGRRRIELTFPDLRAAPSIDRVHGAVGGSEEHPTIR